jgi:LemA protein
MVPFVITVSTVAFLLWGVFSFNRFIRLRNQVRAAWADIDVQLRRRHDLVPNLVAAVEGYARHEKATFELVTELRSQALGLSDPAQLGKVETRLADGISRLIALQEAYPDLKASENFAALQRDLVEIEDHLQYARRFYNGSVRDFNTLLERFPDLVVGKAFGFSREAFFQAEEGERETPVLRGLKESGP